MAPAKYVKKYPEQTKLKQLMYDRGITQSVLAEYLGIGQGTLNCRNNGILQYNLEEIHLLIKYFNLPFEEIF